MYRQGRCILIIAERYLTYYLFTITFYLVLSLRPFGAPPSSEGGIKTREAAETLKGISAAIILYLLALAVNENSLQLQIFIQQEQVGGTAGGNTSDIA